jgi:hypothetical protein
VLFNHIESTSPESNVVVNHVSNFATINNYQSVLKYFFADVVRIVCGGK